MRQAIFFCFFLTISIISISQSTYKLKADSVAITNNSSNAELILENSTKNVNGFLYNKGNGRTEFRKPMVKLNDSTYLFGSDTLKLNTAANFNFTNGINHANGLVKLGGALTGSTTIGRGTYDFNIINGSGDGLQMGNWGTAVFADNGNTEFGVYPDALVLSQRHADAAAFLNLRHPSHSGAIDFKMIMANDPGNMWIEQNLMSNTGGSSLRQYRNAWNLTFNNTSLPNFFGINGPDLSQWFRITDGTVKMSSLGGTSSRMVIADANGVLSTQSIPGGNSFSFSNGLSNTSNTIKLGGTLTENTEISTGTNKFEMIGSNSYWGFRETATDGIFYMNMNRGPSFTFQEWRAGGTDANSYFKSEISGPNVKSYLEQGATGIKFQTKSSGVYKGILIDTSSNIVFENYPTTRNDGSATKFLTTDASGNVQLKTVDFSSGMPNYTFSNGLSNANGTIKLGGIITEPTTIETATNFSIATESTALTITPSFVHINAANALNQTQSGIHANGATTTLYGEMNLPLYPSSRNNGSATKFLTTDGSGNVQLKTVDFSGSVNAADFIQNQNASAQTSNFWINGTGAIGNKLLINTTDQGAYKLQVSGDIWHSGNVQMTDGSQINLRSNSGAFSGMYTDASGSHLNVAGQNLVLTAANGNLFLNNAVNHSGGATYFQAQGVNAMTMDYQANLAIYKPLAMAESIAPNTPGTGFGIIYPKSDGLWYGKDDSGVETKLSNEAASGTVTSVALTTPSWLNVASSPITTSGTLAVTAATGQTANQFLATPDGSTGAVGLRSIVAADIPNLDAGKIATGTMAAARLGSGTANNTTYLGGDQTYHSALLSKAVSFQAPTGSENVTLWYTPVALTITEVAESTQGTSPSVTYNIRYASTRNAGSPTNVFASNRTVTTSAGTSVTSFANASIPAGSWIWVITSATAGTVNDFNATIIYRQ
jgi:hypothetical protein